MSYLGKRKNAFYYAFSGLAGGFREEAHLRIHLVATIVVVTAGFYFQLSTLEWVAVAVAIALVLICEFFNTCIERTCDLIDKEKNEKIKYVKDLSAAAVLVASILAVVVACLIFLPRLV